MVGSQSNTRPVTAEQENKRTHANLLRQLGLYGPYQHDKPPHDSHVFPVCLIVAYAGGAQSITRANALRIHCVHDAFRVPTNKATNQPGMKPAVDTNTVMGHLASQIHMKKIIKHHNY